MKAFALAVAAALTVGHAEAKVVQINGFVATNTTTGDRVVMLKDTWALWMGDEIVAVSNIDADIYANEMNYTDGLNQIRIEYLSNNYPQKPSIWFHDDGDTYVAEGPNGELRFFPFGDALLGAEADRFPLYRYFYTSYDLGDGIERRVQFNRVDIAPVPLPAAAPMLLTGAAALFGLRRIRKAKR